MLFRAAILTVSDKGARGEREDTSGALIRQLLQTIDMAVDRYEIIPDELSIISERLSQWADAGRLDLIVTTGGTGLAPRDVTPQATLGAIDYAVPGIAEAMRAASLKVTPAGMLSRGVAGVRRGKLIINLPGNPKAVRENLHVIAAALPHAITTLKRDIGEHTRPEG